MWEHSFIWQQVSRKRWRFLLGFLLSSLISLAAYRRRSLSGSGVVGAVATGTAIVGLGGWAWGGALVYFFISSSFFSHVRAREKATTAADKFSKGSQRDIMQVAANGGVATLLAVISGSISAGVLQQALEAGYVGAFAAATADTWATELGVLSPQQPRLITTGKRVAPGTSGGVTPLGTAAGALGACSLGLVFWAFKRCSPSRAALPVIALGSGMIGSLVDSLLGATAQAMFYCPVCGKDTERRVHSCGAETRPLRGLPWFDNDVVNFLATVAGALTGISLHGMLKRRATRQLLRRVR